MQYRATGLAALAVAAAARLACAAARPNVVLIYADGFKYIAVRYTPEVQEKIKAGKKYSHWCLPAEDENHLYGADRNYPGYFDADQLYDLKADPREQRNLARDPAHAARLEALRAELRDRSQRLPHPFGEFKP